MSTTSAVVPESGAAAEPLEAPYFPIVYIRGYAGTQGEVEDTVADPYMGFNVGSTKIRQLWNGSVVRHVFESPLVRLMKDEGYRDVYDAGAIMAASTPIPARSVWIYRYYDDASKELGPGTRGEIEAYALGLRELILQIRERCCTDETQHAAFRVHLVAHSMGGLIARCYLQQVCQGQDPLVDKVFTYATPHGGIRLVGVNVPAFVTMNQVDTFSQARMREFLALPETADVRSLDDRFPAERFFCLVGTNYRDYAVSGGLARRAVGHMSDGLVMIANAYVPGAPRAFVARSHSGHYGIVNSEEGYQNLRRFLFGDVRADALLDILEVALPPKLEALRQAGKTVKASYHIEVIARVRGARWELHRRTVEDESAIFEEEGVLVQPGKTVCLASIFLSSHARVNKDRPTLGFSLDLRVLVPQYDVDQRLLWDDHYEGGYLYRDKLNLEATLPTANTPASLRYGFDSVAPNQVTDDAKVTALPGDRYRFEIPVVHASKPGIRARLYIDTRPWR